MKKTNLLFFAIPLFLSSCLDSVPEPDVSCLQPEISASPSSRTELNGSVSNLEINVEGAKYKGWVYVPEAFTGADGPFPAVFFLSGIYKAPVAFNDTDMAGTLEEMFAGDCQPFIFIALPCQDYYHEFEDSFIHHLVPFIRQEFDVSPDNDRVAVGGISSGGDLANRMYFSYPTLFSHLGQHSAAITKNDLQLWEQRMKKLRRKKHRSFYFNVGTEDPLLEIYGLLEPVISEADVDYHFYRTPGSHDAYYYQTVFDDIVYWYGRAVTGN